MVDEKNKTPILIFNKCSKKSSSTKIKQLSQITLINHLQRKNWRFRNRRKRKSPRTTKKKKMAKIRRKSPQGKMQQ
jgi:hypothetical protein